jgi:hypothetical protein
VRQRLGDEHPVEGVAMETRQSSGACCMFYGNWQLLEIPPSNGPAEGQRRRAREFAEPVLRGNLPSRRSANQYIVAVICNRLPCGRRLATIPGKPPDKRMGVEQQLYCSISFPGSQFFLRQRIKEAVVEFDPALHGAGLPFASTMERHEPSNGFAVAGDDDLLTIFDLREQTRQMGLRLMDVHHWHRWLLDL